MLRGGAAPLATRASSPSTILPSLRPFPPFPSLRRNYAVPSRPFPSPVLQFLSCHDLFLVLFSTVSLCVLSFFHVVPFLLHHRCFLPACFWPRLFVALLSLVAFGLIFYCMCVPSVCGNSAPVLFAAFLIPLDQVLKFQSACGLGGPTGQVARRKSEGSARGKSRHDGRALES